MKIKYYNENMRIFEGYYESNLYNSNTEYNLAEILETDVNNINLNFDEYQKQLNEYIAEQLHDVAVTFNHDYIISDISYFSMVSPKYYNYDTDRLVFEIELNLKKLRLHISNNIKDFEYYLKDNYSSYDGYISFISNNIKDFTSDYLNKDKIRQCVSVMIEYYLIRCIYDCKLWQDIKLLNKYDTTYHYNIFDKARDLQIENAIAEDKHE